MGESVKREKERIKKHIHWNEKHLANTTTTTISPTQNRHIEKPTRKKITTKHIFLMIAH